MASKLLFKTLETILVLCGGLCLLWGLFCLAGGPDGAAGSKESLIFASGFISAGSLLLYSRTKLKAYRRKDHKKA